MSISKRKLKQWLLSTATGLALSSATLAQAVDTIKVGILHSLVETAVDAR
jgi:multidrug transporter EmrE-like cation transporter